MPPVAYASAPIQWAIFFYRLRRAPGSSRAGASRRQHNAASKSASTPAGFRTAPEGGRASIRSMPASVRARRSHADKFTLHRSRQRRSSGALRMTLAQRTPDAVRRSGTAEAANGAGGYRRCFQLTCTDWAASHRGLARQRIMTTANTWRAGCQSRTLWQQPAGDARHRLQGERSRQASGWEAQMNPPSRRRCETARVQPSLDADQIDKTGNDGTDPGGDPRHGGIEDPLTTMRSGLSM